MSKVIGIDVGGTFTDLVFFDEGTRTCRVAKVSSTPANQAEGVLTGIASLGEGLPSVDAIVHGTTVATNALLERKGARLALVTTRGFRDVLEMHTRESVANTKGRWAFPRAGWRRRIGRTLT